MKILIIEPYYSGSHAAWANGYQKYSSHEISLLTLPGEFWKWRMHGGAITLTRLFQEQDLTPDLIVATDMLDLTTFLALGRDRLFDIPIVLYFHENQLCYPWSPIDRDLHTGRDKHYGFINISSALAASWVSFNSQFHQDSFLEETRKFLRSFPDFQEPQIVDEIAEKSSILPVGIECTKLDRAEPLGQELRNKYDINVPLILWNHRWEFDKNPDEFFSAVEQLSERGIDFRLAVLGEEFVSAPPAFERAKNSLKRHIVQWGYVESFEEYAAWLWASDILPITSNQEFFGISVAEAIYCRTVPLLPKRLCYPELYGGNNTKQFFYGDGKELIEKLQQKVEDYRSPNMETSLYQQVSQFDWKNVAALYDGEFQRAYHHDGHKMYLERSVSSTISANRVST